MSAKKKKNSGKKNKNVNQNKKTNNVQKNNVPKQNLTETKKQENKKVDTKKSQEKNNKKIDDKNNLKKEIDNDKKTENIIFKNDKKENPKNIKKSENIKNEKEKKKNDNEKIIQMIDEKENKKRKALAIFINISVIALILMIFSTIFAIIQANKITIAKGVSIKNIDVSNLTYEEARAKLEEALNIEISVNIDLKYKDYSYTMKPEEISLKYDIENALNEAYQVGRGSSIIKNNYNIIFTAFKNKNIDFEFDYNEEELDKVVDYVSTNVPDLIMQYSYYIEENELIINPGTDGIQVNKDNLKEKIKNDISNRDLAKLINDYKNSSIDIPYENVKAEKIDIDKIYGEVHSEPKNAYYTQATETTDFAIYPDTDGIDFAVSMEEAKNIISQEGVTEYIIPLNRKKADVTINDIGIEAFPHKISSFPTKYDASNINRSENLRIAASKINGTVLMPGQMFSFNTVVGERTIAEGYKNAAIYSDGQVVDGLAGGICQISSTLYNAVLLANLQIDERHNHSFTTSYVKPGRDATVVYGVKDFKFTNNRNYPIKIEAIVANGVATFNIYGIKEKNEYTVKILPVVTETVPYTVQTIQDPSLPAGKIAISQAGASGCKVTTYKEVSLNGVVISKEIISNDVYKVMTRIIRKGPSTAPASAPATPVQ